MMEVVITVLLALGAIMVVVGTVGLLRFPDLPTRLHAVAKADNLGLGIIVTALILHTITIGGEEGSPVGIVVKLVLIWLLALLGTAANSHLLASHRRDAGCSDNSGEAP